MSEQTRLYKVEPPIGMAEEVASIMSMTLVKLCRIADRYYMDRNSVVINSAFTFMRMVTTIDANSFKADEEETVE